MEMLVVLGIPVEVVFPLRLNSALLMRPAKMLQPSSTSNGSGGVLPHHLISFPVYSPVSVRWWIVLLVTVFYSTKPFINFYVYVFDYTWGWTRKIQLDRGGATASRQYLRKARSFVDGGAGEQSIVSGLISVAEVQSKLIVLCIRVHVKPGSLCSCSTA